MSNLFNPGDSVKAMGANGKVMKSDPGTGAGDSLVLVRFADGTERYVTEVYLKNENPKAKAKKAEVKETIEEVVEAIAPVVEVVKETVPKAAAPAKKKAPKKKAAPKKSANKK